MLCLKVRQAQSFFYLTNAKHLICIVQWFISTIDRLLNMTAEESPFRDCGLNKWDKVQVKIYVMLKKNPFRKFYKILAIV